MAHNDHLRRQVYDLAIGDLQSFPVWEFAQDEEGFAGQNEATVRPYTKRPVDPRAGTLIVRSNFALADGSVFEGYISPPPRNSESELSHIQPVIVTERGQVAFWFGIMKPTPDDLRALLAMLGKQPDQVFPVTYNTSIDLLFFGSVTGCVDGFSFLDGQDAAIIRLGSGS